MATTSKKFRANEINSITTNVHETLPVTGSLVVDNNNIKSYGHDRYVSVYDADPALASANQLMDISYCSKLDYDATQSDVTKDRLTMYNQFSQVLTGFNTDGSLKGFHVASGSSTQEIDNFFVVALPRYLVKDKLDGKDFKFEYGGKTITVSGSSSDNSPAGEFYELQTDNETTQGNCGILYVEAGIALISIEAFNNVIPNYANWSADPITMVAYNEFRGVFEKMTFKNTVEVNSTIYTCHVYLGDFNYSNNPTFTDASGSIRNSTDKKTYITGIGLHGPAGELLATAKLSQPKEKTNAKNYLFNVRLDY